MHKEGNGPVCYPLRMDHLPEYFYQKAQKELNETPETREVELRKLKDLLSADELTTGIEFEEDFLHQFLRHREYNSLRAFQYLQKYRNFRRSHSSMFQSIPDEHWKGNPASEWMSVLPYRCPDGCIILFTELEIMHKEGNGPVCYPLRMDHLPEYFYQKAQKELNETPETREVQLRKLKDLLSADKLTTGIEFKDDLLHQFLRHRKYNSLRAFQYLQEYMNFRRSHSSLFQSIPEVHLRGNPAFKWISVLPYRCPEGCAIFLIEIGKWDPNGLSFEYFKREALASYMQAIRCPMTQITGFKIIYDFKDTFKLIRYFTPQNMLLVYNAAFNCIPGRYKEVHFINKSIALTAMWAVLKHVFSEKMRKRFFFHSNPEDLLKYFPRSILPSQYGGSLTNYHDEELMRKMNKDHGDCPEGGQPNYF